MSGNAKLLIAVFIVALAATSARAAKPKIITPREIDATSFEDAADGRQVRIMREEPKLAQKTVPLAARFVEADEMADAQEPIDEGAPVPPPAEGGGETFEPMLGLSNGSCGEWCDGDCADCSVPCDACDDCGLMDCGCDPYWRHRSYVFGQYLYFLPADADLSYAIQQNGVGGTGTVPYGQVGVLQPNFSSGFRTGFGVAVGCNATIAASYSNFRNHTTSQLTAPSGVGGTVNSLVLYPGTINAGSTNQLTTAGYDINYQLADIEYRRLIYGDDWHVFNYALGARYGKLSQQFSQVDNFASPTGVVQTASNINYEGVGFRAGLDGNRRLGNSLLAVYGKTSINVLFGQVHSNYTQYDATTATLQAQSIWRDRRTVPILDYEVGMQWTSRNGHWRASTGYYAAFWFNAVSTGEFIRAVQNSNFVNLGETLSFNGLVSRVEYRF